MTTTGMKQWDPVTLATIGQGALAELFEAELKRVLANIEDINTDPKAKRVIKVELIFRPGTERNVADIEIKASSKLAGLNPIGSVFYVGRQDGVLVAIEHDPKQNLLFDKTSKPAPISAVAAFPQKG